MIVTSLVRNTLTRFAPVVSTVSWNLYTFCNTPFQKKHVRQVLRLLKATVSTSKTFKES